LACAVGTTHSGCRNCYSDWEHWPGRPRYVCRHTDGARRDHVRRSHPHSTGRSRFEITKARIMVYAGHVFHAILSRTKYAGAAAATGATTKRPTTTTTATTVSNTIKTTSDATRDDSHTRRRNDAHITHTDTTTTASTTNHDASATAGITKRNVDS
jgi:cytoskeletal protein RodZ